MKQSFCSELSSEELTEFESTYTELVSALTNDPELTDIPKTVSWLETVVHYNVPHGKKVRGLMVPMTYKSIVPNASKDELRQAYILGWCIEILQASCLLADDMMDDSTTRRGRPCWYLADGGGIMSLNDSYLLEHAVYQLLKKYFADNSCYISIVDLFLDVSHKTIFGQNLDIQTGRERNMEEYTLERYAAIVKYKTSYYTAYLPIVVAMTLAGIETQNDSDLSKTVERITLEIGHYFQVQDDYIDVFGNEKETGKMGTDIQDCKCSWLFVTAREKCTEEQWQLLKANYGDQNAEKVELVKNLFVELDIPGEYSKYEEDFFQNICAEISTIENDLPEDVFLNLLHLIYKRGK